MYPFLSYGTTTYIDERIILGKVCGDETAIYYGMEKSETV